MTDEPPKKKKKGVTIEELMNQEQWDNVRKRLKRISSPVRVGELLYHSADNPNVPKDIFRSLFKILKGERDHEVIQKYRRQSQDIDFDFWDFVCNYKRDRDWNGKTFDQVCSRQSLSSLRIFLKQHAKIFGRLSTSHCRSTICSMWSRRLTDTELDTFIQIHSREDFQVNNALVSLWEKTELLVKSTGQKGPLIHTMLKARLPLVVVWIATKLYPNQMKERDGDGRIPLHWACLLNNLNTEERCGYYRFKPGGVLKRVTTGRSVDLILEAFPGGARYVDAEGSLPLALLLDTEYRSWTFNDWTQRCALAVMRAAPEALVTRNIKNFMLPFMTAACIHDGNTTQARTKEQEQEMLQRKMNLTYALLRQDPSVVSLGVKESPREKYLQRKLVGLEKELEEQMNKSQRLEKELEEWKTRCKSQQDGSHHELN